MGGVGDLCSGSSLMNCGAKPAFSSKRHSGNQTVQGMQQFHGAFLKLWARFRHSRSLGLCMMASRRRTQGSNYPLPPILNYCPISPRIENVTQTCGTVRNAYGGNVQRCGEVMNVPAQVCHCRTNVESRFAWEVLAVRNLAASIQHSPSPFGGAELRKVPPPKKVLYG